MKTKLIRSLTLALFIITLIIACDRKVDSSDVTNSRKRVFDNAALLSDQEEKDLTVEILTFEENVGPQIAIVIVDTLNGEEIEEFSLRTAEKMNLGRSKFDDGLLITFSIKDRNVRIEVSYGLEKIVKDEIAAQIIRSDIVPQFKDGKFYTGFKAALGKIKKLIEENRELIGQRP